MGRVLEFLVPVMVIVAIVYATASGMASRQTHNLSQDNKRLREENADLRKDESTKLKDLRAEIDQTEVENSDLHRLLDEVMVLTTEPVNSLNLGNPHQAIANTIARKRPRRK